MGTKTREIRIPYGTGCEILSLEGERAFFVLEPAHPEELGKGKERGLGEERDKEDREEEIIRKAMENPIGSPRLRELALGKKKVVIISSDHTRPAPSRLIIPLMLKEIREGSPEAEITILIGVGCHRSSSKEEIEAKFGREVAVRERIVNHDPLDERNLISLGRLPSGGDLRINRMAYEADLLVADGLIEPHQFAGFSGGRKSVLPGIAAFKTVLASHNAEFTVHPKARPGSLKGNPFQTDMVHAAKVSGLSYIVNAALSSDKKTLAAFAGHFDEAHNRGCEYVLSLCEVKAVPSPIVIASNGGYPLDQNIYQSTKSVMAGDLSCQDGGVIISVNECRDGHGSESFLKSFKNASSLDSLLKEIEIRGREETIPDQWVIQLTASILKRRKVIMVTKADLRDVEALGMRKTDTLSEALILADKLLGTKNAPAAVLPNAVAVVISP
jgi:nickel-dependent lactate racemase